MPAGQTIALPLAGSTPAADSHAGHDHKAGEAHKSKSEDEHAHAPLDPNAPWLVRNRDIAVSLGAAVFLALGWATESLSAFPFLLAVGFYVVSYVLGGHK